MKDSFSSCEKEGLYKAIFSRRDVRSHFINKEIPDEVLARILNAPHHAPSVGFSQPWNFILIKDDSSRRRVKNSFLKERERSISMLDNDKTKQEKYFSLKLEGIMESPLNICITYDSTRFGPFVPGRTSIAETGLYSVCCRNSKPLACQGRRELESAGSVFFQTKIFRIFYQYLNTSDR